MAELAPALEYGLVLGQFTHLLVVGKVVLFDTAVALKVPAGHVSHVVPHVDPVFIAPVPLAHVALVPVPELLTRERRFPISPPPEPLVELVTVGIVTQPVPLLLGTCPEGHDSQAVLLLLGSCPEGHDSHL